MKTRITIIGIAIMLLLSSSCQKSLQDIIEDTKNATVTIYTYDEYGSPAGVGSGFFIDDEGMGITNYHVLDEVTKATLKTNDGTEYEIDSVLTSDKNMDIIKFSIKNKDNRRFRYLRLANDKLKQGDRVYNISAPMGLEQTVSEGIISAIREDSHGEVIQITAPISSGSSGSAILNERGEVIAVATFLYKGGQNLNFGVIINDEKLSQITNNEFDRRNKRFNQKENFVIVNIAATKKPNIRLNALEFKKDATTAYFSCTNLDMSTGSEAYIWTELNKRDDGFYILDKASNRKYYIISSTIGESKKDGTVIPLASTYQFKVEFEPIKNYLEMEVIDIYEGNSGNGWKFEDIDIKSARLEFSYDIEGYNKNYGYVWMHEGELDYAASIFTAILEEDSEDEDALNALGIIAYVQGNYRDAVDYFSEAIEYHTSSVTGYKNRAELYEYLKEYSKALLDWNKVIGMDNKNPDNYVKRGFLYYIMEEWGNSVSDFSKALEYEDYKNNASLYFYRACCYIFQKEYRLANNDLRDAYRLNEDPELDKEIKRLYNSIP